MAETQADTSKAEEPLKKVPGKLNTAFLQQKFEAAASALSPANSRPAPGKLKFNPTISDDSSSSSEQTPTSAPKPVGRIAFNAALGAVLAGGPKPIKKEERKDESVSSTDSVSESKEISTSSLALEHATMQRAKLKKRAPTKKPVFTKEKAPEPASAMQVATKPAEETEINKPSSSPRAIEKQLQEKEVEAGQPETVSTKSESAEPLPVAGESTPPSVTDAEPAQPTQSAEAESAQLSSQSKAKSPVSQTKSLLDPNKIGAALLKQIQTKQEAQAASKPSSPASSTTLSNSEIMSREHKSNNESEQSAAEPYKASPPEYKSSGLFSETEQFLLLPFEQQQKILLAEKQARELEEQQKVSYKEEHVQEYVLTLTQGIEITQYKPKAKQRFLYVTNDGMCYYKDVDKKGRNKHTPEEDRAKKRFFDLKKVTLIQVGKEHPFWKENRKAVSDAVYSCCFSLIGEAGEQLHLEAMSGRQAEFLVEAFCYFWKRPQGQS